MYVFMSKQYMFWLHSEAITTIRIPVMPNLYKFGTPKRIFYNTNYKQRFKKRLQLSGLAKGFETDMKTSKILS